VGTEDHLLYVLTVHKSICDRESVLSQEVATNYASIEADRPLPPTVQYRHYLQSQEGYLRGSAYATEVAYWKNRLQNAAVNIAQRIAGSVRFPGNLLTKLRTDLHTNTDLNGFGT